MAGGGGGNNGLGTLLAVGTAIAAPELAPALLPEELAGTAAGSALLGGGMNLGIQALMGGKIDPRQALLASAGAGLMSGMQTGNWMPDSSAVAAAPPTAAPTVPNPIDTASEYQVSGGWAPSVGSQTTGGVNSGITEGMVVF